MIPEKLKDEFSVELRGNNGGCFFSIAYDNILFEKWKLRLLKKLSNKYDFPLDKLKRHYDTSEK